MNTSKLKSFAPDVRTQLMEAVGRKLDYVLTADTPDLRQTAAQVASLRREAGSNRAALIERVAYTWFNRLAALRFLDAQGWHPFKARVLTPATPEETQPELLKLLRTGTLPAELHPHADLQRLNDLLDGRLPTAIAGSDPQGEAYRGLILAACRFYHTLLPDVFDKLNDESELLLPDDLLTTNSVAEGFRTEISDADCLETDASGKSRANVEILGWLYQFYISEKKDAVMARKSAVPTEDIPAVTQLFTPHWIVRYLVENSLGRLWLLNRPGSRLREHMPYYIEGEKNSPGGSPDDFLKITKPEEIRLCDPAVGSGHMLTYAFDLLFLIYEEEGYAPTEIPALILRHNLHGLEICPRAAQLAELALVFKAREKSRRFFQPEHLVRPHVIELQNITFTAVELADYFNAIGPVQGETSGNSSFNLKPSSFILHPSSFILHPSSFIFRKFEEAKNFGSLIQPCLSEAEIQSARQIINHQSKIINGDLMVASTHLKVLRVLEQAEALTQRYHVVVANPPYMGRRTAMNAALKAFIGQHYDHCRADVYAAFLQRSFDLCISNGLPALVTMQSWLFLSSYLGIRSRILTEYQISNLAHLGARAFDEISGEVVQTAAIVFKKAKRESNIPVCFRLVDGDSSAKERTLIEGLGRFESMCQQQFLALPDCPIVYWLPKAIVDAFSERLLLENISDQRQGLATGDDGSFIRMWSEISSQDFNLHPQLMPCERPKWFQFIKGGGFRKWYGNNEHCIRFDRESFDKLSRQGNCLPSKAFYLRKSLTWSDIAGSVFGARFNPEGKVFGTGALSAFPKDDGSYYYVLAYLNSVVNQETMSALSSGIHYSVGYVDKSPIKVVSGIHGRVSQLSGEAVDLARADWDNFETSWDFRDQPLLRLGLKGATLEASWRNWEAQSTAAIRRMQELETANNRLFIAAYGLDGELQPEVPEAQITLFCNPESRYKKKPKKKKKEDGEEISTADDSIEGSGEELSYSLKERSRFFRADTVGEFLSYAVGCMMGRYSPDHPGLILANSGDTLREFLEKVGKPLAELTFAPDEDGIIPVLDGEWFEDDIVARTRDFLRATFGEATLKQNLRFIEESLGKSLDKYFLTDFYKDHLQTYKKRPIYWLFQSPKKGFSALVYVHRYTKDTVNTLLNKYLRDYLKKLESRINHLVHVEATATATKEKTAARKEADKLKKDLKDCQDWERNVILPLAQQRLEIDLDDGVKINYLKFEGAVQPIPGLTTKGEE